ncbi:hypothetical protein D9M69_673540 [compost metagenome]
MALVISSVEPVSVCSMRAWAACRPSTNCAVRVSRPSVRRCSLEVRALASASARWPKPFSMRSCASERAPIRLLVFSESTLSIRLWAPPIRLLRSDVRLPIVSSMKSCVAPSAVASDND